MGLPAHATMAQGEGRNISQPATRSRGVPMEQAQTATGGTTGTAAMRGTGHPLHHTATGALGIPTVTTVARGKWRTIGQTDTGSTGIPTPGKAVQDPATATDQMPAVVARRKIKPTEPRHQGVQADEPLDLLLGLKTCQVDDSPFGQCQARTGFAFCPTLWSRWRRIRQQTRRSRWRWIRLRQN